MRFLLALLALPLFAMSGTQAQVPPTPTEIARYTGLHAAAHLLTSAPCRPLFLPSLEFPMLTVLSSLVISAALATPPDAPPRGGPPGPPPIGVLVMHLVEEIDLPDGERQAVRDLGDQARAELLAFAAQLPATAWQELAVARGETVAGRLRFAPSAPVRLALWRKPALS